MKVTPAIKETGFGISGDIGGLPRTTYWTPDGRMIKAIAQMRDYVKRDKDNNVIEQGTRDANLDNGWLLQKPAVLIPQCPCCARWHANQAEAEVCKIQQAKKDELLAKVVEADIKTEMASKDAQISDLVAQVQALRELVEKALRKDGAK